MEAVGGHKKGFKLLRSSSEAIARRARRGFNLIEAAIVLAVVGGVIGAIWTAAANMYESHKVNKTVSDIALIAFNARKLISIRDGLAIGNSVNITSSFINAGIFPEDWVRGNIVKNPFGGNVNINNYAGGGTARFDLTLSSIKRSSCIKISVGVFNLWANGRSEIRRIQTNNGTVIADNLSPNQAETLCNTDVVPWIIFVIDYTRIN